MFAVASKTTVAAPRAANLIRQTNRRQSAAKCRRNRVATNEVAPSAPAMSNRYALPRASRRRSSSCPPPAPVALNGALPPFFFPLARPPPPSLRRARETHAAPLRPISPRRNPSAEVIELIQSASAFCFDVDSTVCVDEGIDELAAFLGKGEEVAELTRRAMGGSVSFRDALEARLQVMQPTKEAVETYVMENPPKLSPGIKDLFDVLRANGKAVYLVSGGFRHMINPVADALDVPRENIYANDLRFKADGSYDSFNPEEFTSAAGGRLRR